MRRKRENGEVVVEASIVVSIALIFITVMLFIGIVLYHQTMLTSVANKTAASVAQLYSNSMKDPFTGYVDSDSVYQAITYDDFKTDEYVAEIELKANALAKYRLNSSSMLKAEFVDVDVQLVNKPGELLKSQIIVTLKGQYVVPLVGFFNIGDGKTAFSVTGRADCFDLLEYVNGVEAIGSPEVDNIVPVVEDTCVVTFMLNQYDGGFHAAVPVLQGKSIISSNHYSHSSMPKMPVFGDLEFTGWVTADGTGFNANTTVNSDMTVYATWLCLVTLDPTGGTVAPTQKTVAYKNTTNLPNPTRAGYAFEGWYTAPEGGGTRYYSDVTEITENITLYAKWRCTHDFTSTQIREGTCRQKYRFRYTCIRCPYSYEADGDWGVCKKGNAQITVAPSCLGYGTRITKCVYCSSVLVNETLAKLPHNQDIKEPTVAPTCTAGGYTNYKCSMCKRVQRTDRTSALGHDMRSHSTAATCTTGGFSGQKCTRCSHAIGSYSNALGHAWDARCGADHNMGNDTRVLSSHNKSAGYWLTTWGECILCIRCHAPRDGWVIRNGQMMSQAIICRKHHDNSGRHVYCGSWKSMTNIHLHG